MFDEDNREKSLFYRPKTTIHVSGPDGETLPPIEVDELVVAPELLTIDHAAQRAAAATIVESSPFTAADVAVNVESTNPVLALEIRKALERRANRSQQSHTPLRGERTFR
jgi:hypothetical protein